MWRIILPNFTGQVAASTDDAHEQPGGNTQTGSPLIRVTDGTFDWCAFRIPNVTIPQGATIDAAAMDLYIINTDAEFILYCEDVDDAAVFDGSSTDISGRTRTTASVTFSEVTGSNAQSITGLDALVQEVVDRPSWSSGNAMVFIFERQTGANFRFRAHDNLTSDGPGIDVDYTEAGGSFTPLAYAIRARKISHLRR